MSLIMLPEWAEEMKKIFRSETISQFVISGNINDLVPIKAENDKIDFVSIKQFLTDVLFIPFDVVIFYDRGKGISIHKGMEHFQRYLEMFDSFHGSSFSTDSGAYKNALKSLDSPGLLPRDPNKALELIDRYIGNVANVAQNSPQNPAARSIAVVVNYAHFIVPEGDSLYLSGEIAVNLIKILNWAQDPVLQSANIITVLLTENLSDINKMILENAYNSKIQIKLPDKQEIFDFISNLVKGEKNFTSLCELDIPNLSDRLIGLSRINIKSLLLKALRNNEKLTHSYITKVKKEIIEKESFGKLEFIESKRTLDDVSGSAEAKAWLREDAQLMKQGKTRAMPMGYLVCGRIGTGKTYLIECFSGECGVPFVVMKNFRDKWVGATEGNLEKIFNILHALGQVVVFIDEADQMTGKRDGGDGDGGLSGRVYGMLAKEMSNTENRGKILWIFATSRPDLVEVDLKRQGRLDVHIPLFPPSEVEDKKALFLAMARKLKIDLKPEDVPELKFKEPISGNEIEGLLIRALREFELQSASQNQKTLPEIIKNNMKTFRPSAHTAQLELMDLLAVKECTDDRFLPKEYLKLDKDEIENKINALLIRLPGYREK